MRKKISITISSDVIAEIGRSRGPNVSRFAFIERILRDDFFQRRASSLSEREREAIDRRDIEFINANAEYFNRERNDLLSYQAPIDFSEEE